MSAACVDAAADLLAFDFMSNRLPPSAAANGEKAAAAAESGAATDEAPRAKRRRPTEHAGAGAARPKVPCGL